VATISIGRTVSESYKFAFQRYFQLLGVIWLPLVLLGAIALVTIVPFFAALGGMLHEAARQGADGDSRPFLSPESLQALARMRATNLLFDVADLAFFAIVSVGVTKEALGLRRGFRPVYIAWGLDELLVAGGFFLVWVMLVVFIVVAVIFCVLIGAIGIRLLHGAYNSSVGAGVGTAAIIVLLAIIAGCALIYFAIRLLFFIAPVTVAEREFAVFRSWELSKGHAWEIFAVLFLTWVPVIVVLNVIGSIAFGYAALPPILVAMRSFRTHDPAAVAAIFDAIQTSLKANWPWLLALYLIPLPVVNGLIWAPAAFAYRELKPAAELPAPA